MMMIIMMMNLVMFPRSVQLRQIFSRIRDVRDGEISVNRSEAGTVFIINNPDKQPFYHIKDQQFWCLCVLLFIVVALAVKFFKYKFLKEFLCVLKCSSK